MCRNGGSGGEEEWEDWWDKRRELEILGGMDVSRMWGEDK
jgi:hypothetical protein